MPRSDHSIDFVTEGTCRAQPSTHTPCVARSCFVCGWIYATYTVAIVAAMTLTIPSGTAGMLSFVCFCQLIALWPRAGSDEEATPLLDDWHHSQVAVVVHDTTCRYTVLVFGFAFVQIAAYWFTNFPFDEYPVITIAAFFHVITYFYFALKSLFSKL